MACLLSKPGSAEATQKYEWSVRTKNMFLYLVVFEQDTQHHLKQNQQVRPLFSVYCRSTVHSIFTGFGQMRCTTI